MRHCSVIADPAVTAGTVAGSPASGAKLVARGSVVRDKTLLNFLILSATNQMSKSKQYRSA